MPSTAEENYLKVIFKCSQHDARIAVSTNAIAAAMKTSAASVTDMLKKLTDKGWISYERYRGVKLTDTGKAHATELIRKHRLWEVFLVEKLHFAWDEIHQIAEELEHISSPELIRRLDIFLERPQFDPHGHPIPDEQGRIKTQARLLLSELSPGDEATVIAVEDDNENWLQRLETLGLRPGTPFKVLGRDNLQFSISVDQGQAQNLAFNIAETIMVR